MGLFDKREKVDFRKASGLMFTVGVTYQNQGIMAKQNIDVEEKQMIIVNTSYMLGISMLFIASQIGIDRTDEFIKETVKNGNNILTPEMLPILPEIEKLSINVKNFMIKDAVNINKNDLFSELAKKYLNDLFSGEYDQKYIPTAVEEMKFYYSTVEKITSGIKIK